MKWTDEVGNGTPNNSRLTFFCLRHQELCYAMRGSSGVVCEQGSHVISENFIADRWEYCCSCRSFVPRAEHEAAREKCFVCDRQITVRHLCDGCGCLSCETVEPPKGERFVITAAGAIQPTCPCCSKAPTASVLEHQCAGLKTKIYTAREVCPCCGERLKQFRPEPTRGRLITSAPAVVALDPATREYVWTQKGRLEVQVEEQDNSAVQPEPPPAPGWRTWTSATLTAALGHKPALLSGGGVLLVVLVVIVIRLTGPTKPPEPPPSPTPSPTVTPSGMVYVPGGELMMGNSQGGESERPVHTVIVKPFFIDRLEVTCADYQKFLAATERQEPRGWGKEVCLPGAMQRPVTGVFWGDAEAYARWAEKRLPTEEEWEMAARGSDGRRYPWGNDWQAGRANAGGSAKGLADVGSYTAGASPFGVLDMAGNAWEWTASEWKAYPGGNLPPDGSSGKWKVMRGGAWDGGEKFTTTTYRSGYPVSDKTDYSKLGFRCAQDASVTPVPFPERRAR